jgi:threonine dehydratase
VALHTPLLAVARQQTGCLDYLKAENHQLTHAFKFRGAYNYCHELPVEVRAAGLITASSGNHALGLALAGQQLGAPVTVVMPETAPAVKVAGCRDFGASVLRWGNAYDDAARRALELSDKHGLHYVPSFDDPVIAAGQSTIAWEILEDLPEVDVIVTPIGGGGLLAGLLGLIKLLPQQLATRFFPTRRAPLAAIEVIGVQSTGAASMVDSVAAGRRVQLASVATLADGIAVRQPGAWTWQMASAYVDGLTTVGDDDLLATLRALAVNHKTIVEPAGAAAYAAVRLAQDDPSRGHPLLVAAVAGGKRIACVLSGGNIQPELLAQQVS